MSESVEMLSMDVDYVDQLIKQRSNTAPSIMLFNFNKKRAQVLSHARQVPVNSNGVLYWMFRDIRVQDNWAMLLAQNIAFTNRVSLHVCFNMEPEASYALYRSYRFLAKGLKEVEEECTKLNITFHLFQTYTAKSIAEFVNMNSFGAVICDWSPQEYYLDQVKELKVRLNDAVPLCQVDAHNIIPCWLASEKMEYNAKNIRPKLLDNLNYYLTEFPPVIQHPYNSKIIRAPIDWEFITSKIDIYENIMPLLKPGYKAGIKMLQQFCETKLNRYAENKNDPVSDVTSNLSAYIRNGHISAQRCVLTVKATGDNANVTSFIEHALVRRELAENFCYYNDKFNVSLTCASPWAYATLNEHRNDPREYLYSHEQFEKSMTHDELWNSAQIQLIREGTMNGYLRMYWAKKILEWSVSPECALQIATQLNDYYALDGVDPSGYVGCLWSIAGVHDQPWVERPVFGKIRYMNKSGCKKKMNISGYVEKYGGVAHINNNHDPNSSVLGRLKRRPENIQTL